MMSLNNTFPATDFAFVRMGKFCADISCHNFIFRGFICSVLSWFALIGFAIFSRPYSMLYSIFISFIGLVLLFSGAFFTRSKITMPSTDGLLIKFGK